MLTITIERGKCAILPLVLKGEWYDMIERGDKREEYRLLKDYWQKRIYNWYPDMNGKYPVVEFRHGYAKNARRMAFSVPFVETVRDKTVPHRPEWGEPGKPHFIICLGSRVKLEGEETKDGNH